VVSSTKEMKAAVPLEQAAANGRNAQ
jgi:hypothetical protein